MENKTLLLTNYVLQRILKSFAMRMGMDDTFADFLAQAHVQQTPIQNVWTSFLLRNCSKCAKEPGTCTFLNPGPENTRGSATPATMQAAVATSVERGNFFDCPALEPKTRDSAHKANDD